MCNFKQLESETLAQVGCMSTAMALDVGVQTPKCWKLIQPCRNLDTPHHVIVQEKCRERVMLTQGDPARGTMRENICFDKKKELEDFVLLHHHLHQFVD